MLKLLIKSRFRTVNKIANHCVFPDENELDPENPASSIPYQPVDATPVPQTETEATAERSGKRKKVVRYYDGVNPEVEAELKKVIEELEQKGIDKVDVVQ